MGDVSSASCREVELTIRYGPQIQAPGPAPAFSATSRNVWHSLWQVWKRASIVLGSFIGRVLLTVLYFTIVPAFALWVRTKSDPLSLGVSEGHGTPQWHPMEDKVADWGAARRQG
jgi:hypothetical protein